MTVSEISSCFGDEKFFPPGFRFHPTDEELVLYYLKRKICGRRLKLDIIGETDVYKWDPEDLPGLSKLKTGDRQWFFFSPRDRKYPNGSRSNRATMHGYWKATGKDRIVTCNSRSVGVKKTLVFYNGRAPSGLRTNWVMHEYTLDEEELKRCQSAQDYYVLYKVYKKSGAGPKNGEQYGAPFKEEDWVDDACSDLNGLVDQENSVKEVYGNGIISIDNTEANDQFPLNDIEELMNNIVDEPILVSPLAVNCAYALNQLVGEQETQSTLVDYTSRQVNLQLYEAPEVTSAPNIHGEPHVAEEEFFEDFLEMDDLRGPEPTVENFVKPVENLPFGEMDGLSELDVYHDAAMFLREMGPCEVTQISQPCMNNIESETLNYQMELYSNDANEISCQLWTHDESFSVFTPAEANLEAIPSPTSGVVYDSNSANFPTGANQNQNQNQCCEEDAGTDSWFSSALWAFVESIPTTPASASESAIVNRAFERMSSFSRVKINTQNTNDAADNPASTPRRLDRSTSRAVFCFSILVVVCAILWVLIGTSTRVLWRCISS